MKQSPARGAAPRAPAASAAAQTRLYHRLQRAAHRVQKAADRALVDAAGITTAQAAILMLVAAGPDVTQRQVAQQLGLRESAITAVVARLEAAGLLGRDDHPEDGRQWRLSLTRDGRRALDRARAPFAAVNATLDGALSAAEIGRLAGALDRIADAFDAERGET